MTLLNFNYLASASLTSHQSTNHIINLISNTQMKIQIITINTNYSSNPANRLSNSIYLLQIKNIFLKACCSTHCCLNLKHNFLNTAIDIIDKTTTHAQAIIFIDCNLNKILLNKCILLFKRDARHTTHEYGMCDTSSITCTNSEHNKHIKSTTITNTIIIITNTKRNIDDESTTDTGTSGTHGTHVTWIIIIITINILKERYMRTRITTLQQQHKKITRKTINISCNTQR